MNAAREPAFNAPWPALLVSVGLVLAFASQTLWGGPDVFRQYGLTPSEATDGAWGGVLTSLFVHGGWAHVLLNALAALAFGAAVARFFGGGAAGAGLFLLFYLLCGALSGGGYVLLHPLSSDVLVGASGAVSGLMGGASRLIERPGRLSTFSRPAVVGMALGWLAVNLVVAVVGTMPGAGGAPVAWEAHLVGYAAGLLLIGPFARLSPRPDPVLEPWSHRAGR